MPLETRPAPAQRPTYDGDHSAPCVTSPSLRKTTPPPDDYQPQHNASWPRRPNTSTKGRDPARPGDAQSQIGATCWGWPTPFLGLGEEQLT
ncbi:MAG: hypothetical protein H6667_11990 [Ardenticatenaceae bacterium]|nr:hypothetical protein [Ardenticatenaceae bacterium]